MASSPHAGALEAAPAKAHVGARDQARAASAKLQAWLRECALPLWLTRGVDVRNGGFEEQLSMWAEPEPVARRARVQPRQLYVCAAAARMGWRGDAASLATRALDYFIQHFQRADGLFRSQVSADGRALDERVWLYDQAFALLGFSAAHALGVRNRVLESMALQLLEHLGEHLRHRGAGFETALDAQLPLASNPHMHLLEACLAWQSLSGAACWSELAQQLYALALDRLLAKRSGHVHEHFDTDWQPVAGVAGQLIEPGHQFEWAWLLLQAPPAIFREARAAALDLIDLTERDGIHHGVAVDSMLEDGSVHCATARLWPQAERLRALALAVQLTSEPRYWPAIQDAAGMLLRYLDVAVPGLWHDQLDAHGEFIPGPAPAGNLYHIVGSLAALERACAT